MQLLFKQRLYGWFSTTEVLDDQNHVCYRIRGRVVPGEDLLRVFDASNQEVGQIKRVDAILGTKYELYRKNKRLGTLRKDLTLFRPRYRSDFNGWNVKGNLTEWDFVIQDHFGTTIATITKRDWEFFVIDVPNPTNTLDALLLFTAVNADRTGLNC